ncbi:GAF domain-containing sensor histidine kinase [Primorskyibacter marinus]|uniref:GAF domain-containing sensor histidine kinase n=1 Tax=Primorskyibacter marinus TaxID=1977320 RepID=UPI000E300B67|nr:ATP-binding protein [Primorskyibacter marinus]
MNELTTSADPNAHHRDIFLRISNHLARVTEIQSALSAVAQEVAAVLPFTHFDICMIDGQDWLVSYEVGIQTRWSRRRARLINSPVRDVLTGKLDHMICADAMLDPRQIFPNSASEPIFNHNLRSRVHVGMKVMGQLIGTLNISHSQADRFDEETLHFAQHLADLLAPYFHALRAIEKAQRDAQARSEMQSREEGLRQGASSLTQALEQERQRIGMDLHDQTLADLTRLLRVVTNEAQDIDRTYLGDTLTTCIHDLRRIIDEAVPSQLELFGFSHAVSTHLQKAASADRGGAETLTTTVENCTSVDIDAMCSTVRTAIYRITQEAINNAVSHSDASNIVVTIGDDAAGALTISVRDNGRGFARRPGTRQSGLMHMETRARLILADLKITDHGGTSVTLTVPQSAQIGVPT